MSLPFPLATVKILSVTRRHEMSRLIIGFEWQRDANGYNLADPAPWPASSPWRPDSIIPVVGIIPAEGRRLVPNGGKQHSYQPLKFFDTLYRHFARIETEDQALEFANKWGLLTKRDGSEEVKTFLQEADFFRKALKQSHPSRKKNIPEFNIEVRSPVFANLTASIIIDASGRPKLDILPNNLLDALWLQLAQTLASGTDIRTCQLCGQYFEVGSGSKKRLDARFCSDEHRVQFHSRRRSTKKSALKSSRIKGFKA